MNPDNPVLCEWCYEPILNPRPESKYCSLSHAAKASNARWKGTEVQRFWEKVDRHGTDECWPWLGSRDPDGYGEFVAGKRVIQATQFSYELVHGPAPKHDAQGRRLIFLHSCDNPPCVNPNHLSLGTDKDNSDDMIRKGRKRTASGEQNPKSKLTEANVIAIRKLIRNGMPQQSEFEQAAADRLGVSWGTIHRIVTGQAWQHLPIKKE